MALRQAISAPFHKGVNFSNWLEFLPAERVKEDLFTKTDFENVKKLGGDVIRIPMHFECFCKEEENYIIPEKIFGIIDRIAEWADELEIYAIIDFHNSTHIDSVTDPDVEKILFPVWSQLAKRYRDSSPYLVYELMNEPHGIAINLWNEIIERLFKSVREIDKNHYIIVGGADWNSFAAMKTLPDFKDDKVIYTFHFYDPHTFTHQGASWCHMERIKGLPFPYDPEKMPPLPENPTVDEKERFENYPNIGTMEATVQYFDQFVDFSIERNAPVYCGEFGCFFEVEKDKRVNWYRIVTDLLVERNVARTSWDYYGPFGIFKRDSMIKKGKWSIPSFPEDVEWEIVEAMQLNVI